MEISEADYMRMRYEDHKEVTARYVERGSRLFSSKQYQPLEEYMKSENARFINASEIDSISR